MVLKGYFRGHSLTFPLFYDKKLEKLYHACVSVSWYERCLIAPCQLLSLTPPLRNEMNVTLPSVATRGPFVTSQGHLFNLLHKYLLFLKKGKTNIYTLYHNNIWWYDMDIKWSFS